MRTHIALLDHPIGFADRDGRYFDPVTALVVAGSTLAGAAISSNATKSAANTQAGAARDAAQLQNDQWQQTQGNMKPYLDLGTSSISPLLKAMGYNATQNGDGTWSYNGTDSSNPLMQRFAAPTAAEAEASPGYQFTLQQGLKATQNGAAARGLGTSGAALKGASTYATGLADSTYNDVYQRALNTFNTNYKSASDNVNRLTGLVGSGQNAAGGLGALGAQTSANIGNTITSGANASAAGTIGSANALTGALGSVGNNAMLYGLTQNNAGGISSADAAASHTAGMNYINNQLMTG
jgi:hypothetical protein